MMNIGQNFMMDGETISIMPPGMMNTHKRKLYVDCDGVLFMQPFTDIFTAEMPNAAMIEKLRERRAMGDLIVIWSTRTNPRMSPGYGKHQLMEILAGHLKRHNIPYDMIEVADKPPFHMLVDDRAMTPDAFMMETEE